MSQILGSGSGITPPSGVVQSLTGNSGGAVGPDGTGTINVVGANVIDVTGNAGTFTETISITNGTNGQLLIGGGAAPTWANITSTGGSITITNGANSINLESSGAGGGSGWIFIGHLTGNSGSDGYIFNSVDVANYNNFMLVYNNLIGASQAARIQYSTDTGTTWINVGYETGIYGWDFISSSAVGYTSLINDGFEVTSAATNAASGIAYIQTQSSSFTSSLVYTNVLTEVTLSLTKSGIISLASSTTLNALRVVAGITGLVSSGISLYGLKES